MINLYNSDVKIDANQNIYDNFNNFIFSNDRNVFNKLIIKNFFYEKTRNIHGDIIECGVFKGSGLLSWLKLLDMYEPNSLKKVIGFDFFNPQFVESLENEVDRETMKQVFQRDKNLDINDISLDGIHKKIKNAGFDRTRYDLVEGDVSITTEKYLKDKPGLRISILYLDMDLDKPTYDTLEVMWNRMSRGGIVVFDEYAYHSWSESNAVDRFISKNRLKLHNTNIKTPTAYIIKK